MPHKPKGYVQQDITLRDYLIIVHICLSNNISTPRNKVAQWIAQCTCAQRKGAQGHKGGQGVVFFRGNTSRNYLREITTV